MGKINDDTIRENAGALMAISLGNRLLTVSWMITGSLVGTGLIGELIAENIPVDGVVNLLMIVLLPIGAICWPAGLWLIGSPLTMAYGKGLDSARVGCRITAAFHLVGVPAVGLLLVLTGIWSLVVPVAILFVLPALLTPIYAWYLGGLGKRLRSPGAWMFWLWALISLLSTVFYFTGINPWPHWGMGLIQCQIDAGARLAALAIIVLPILFAHIWLQRTLREMIRRFRVDERAEQLPSR